MSFCFCLLGVVSCDFSQAEKKNCSQSEANAQNDNYSNSKRQHRTILNGDSCHFVNLLSFASSSFFLSIKNIA